MNIRVRFGPRDIRQLMVRGPECPTLACFWPATHLIHTSCGASGCSSSNTDWWVCGTNDQQGCPANRVKAEPRTWKKVRDAWERKEGK